jgi:hypothetical protein
MTKVARFGSLKLAVILAPLLVGCSGPAPNPPTGDGTGSPAPAAKGGPPTPAAQTQAAKFTIPRRVNLGEKGEATDQIPITPELRERLAHGLGLTDNSILLPAAEPSPRKQ